MTHHGHAGGHQAGAPPAPVLVARGRVPFAMMPKALVRGSGVSAQAVRLWAVLDSYTYGDDMTPVPSRAQLAVDCDWKSDRSVDIYVKELERFGWLTIERRYRRDGSQDTNRYVLEWVPRAAAADHQSVLTDLLDGAPELRLRVATHAESVSSSAGSAGGGSGTNEAETETHETAGQTGAQNSARGVPTVSRRIVDNCVIAGQTGAQDSAPPRAGFCGGRAQDSAPLKERELSTEKKPPPPAPGGRPAAALVAGAVGVVDSGLGEEPTSPDGGRDIVAAVRAALPRSWAGN